ncbi:MAG: hypothetical protein Ct9H90mP15_00730 [Candidatus Neomarinimicrobiota bacterium]|nr:MAG: hypothetical protein Ct9H90mP15_00730 [Candidatus Neomarinimicrobiota bacterium]
MRKPYQEIIEDFDVYDAALDGEDYALSSTSIVVDDNSTISLLQDGKKFLYLLIRSL